MEIAEYKPRTMDDIYYLVLRNRISLSSFFNYFPREVAQEDVKKSYDMIINSYYGLKTFKKFWKTKDIVKPRG